VVTVEGVGGVVGTGTTCGDGGSGVDDGCWTIVVESPALRSGLDAAITITNPRIAATAKSTAQNQGWRYTTTGIPNSFHGAARSGWRAGARFAFIERYPELLVE
jgi:hypothetical protein